MSQFGLSPRAAPGVYRHSLKTRLYPKVWAKDTQSATAGTLFIQAPRDKSHDIRQGLYSYQTEHRRATRLPQEEPSPLIPEKQRLPDIPFRLQSNTETKTENTEGETVPSSPGFGIPVPDIPRRHQLKLTDPVMMSSSVRGGKLSRSHLNSVHTSRSTGNALSTMIGGNSIHLGYLRMGRSQDSSAGWQQDRNNFHINKTNLINKTTVFDSKTLIPIVGKLPIIRKNAMKTLEQISREKQGNQLSLAKPSKTTTEHLRREQFDQDSVGCSGNKVWVDSTSAKDNTTANDSQKKADGIREIGKSNAPTGKFNSEQSATHEGTLVPKNIDKDCVKELQGSKYVTVQKSPEQENDVDPCQDTTGAHVSGTMLGNSKCYPEFPSDGVPLKKMNRIRTPRKLTKARKPLSLI